MSRSIQIELSPESCSDALKYIKKYEYDVKPRLMEVCRRLAELGANEARRRFSRGDHGNGYVWVDTKPTTNGWKIVANGHDVYFIEFGTGFLTQNHGNVTNVPVYPGSWSETHSRQFAEHGFWYYEGEKLQGTEAEMPMYFAGQVIRANERRIIGEVLGT